MKKKVEKMEVEIYLQGHKFIANSIEEVDQLLKWLKPWKQEVRKEVPKNMRGISMEAWRKSRLQKRGII